MNLGYYCPIKDTDRLVNVTLSVNETCTDTMTTWSIIIQ